MHRDLVALPSLIQLLLLSLRKRNLGAEGGYNMSQVKTSPTGHSLAVTAPVTIQQRHCVNVTPGKAKQQFRNRISSKAAHKSPLSSQHEKDRVRKIQRRATGRIRGWNLSWENRLGEFRVFSPEKLQGDLRIPSSA